MDRHSHALVNMHKASLEALRHREQEILRFVALLGTALGAFVWILGAESLREPARFAAGTYGALLVLVVGASYALALGYNYRYLTLQLAKLELGKHLGLEDAVLAHWPRKIEEFEPRCRWGVVPWCTPPGIIKVFWIAFVVSILGVTVAASFAQDEIVWERPRPAFTGPAGRSGSAPAKPTSQADSAEMAKDAAERRDRWTPLLRPVPYVGVACFLFSLLGPVHVGRKMLKACEAEPPEAWQGRNDETDHESQPEKQDGRQIQGEG